MNGKYLLDTNIVIALFGNDPDVVEQVDKAEKIGKWPQDVVSSIPISSTRIVKGLAAFTSNPF
jgi:hypothetical protein